MSKVLIITPFYNSYIEFINTYQSVVSQTYPYFEWIIVDDFSDPQQSSNLTHLAADDIRIKVIRNKHNLGAGASRNIGLDFFNHTY